MKNLAAIFGEGRGKTSCAMGRLYRKLTEDKTILVAQFLKTGNNCGECNFFSSYENITWLCFGKNEFYKREKKEEFSSLMREGIEEIINIISTKHIDTLLLDEIGMALYFDLVNWDEIEKILSFVKEEIIITGRIIPEEIKQRFNENILIEEIKHPYQQNIKARQGIDY